MSLEFERKIRSALSIDLPYSNRVRLSHSNAQAAVLVLFGLSREAQPWLLYIRRAEDTGPHSGQMAFPGGKAETYDQNDPVETALRETHEEVGVERNWIRVLGQLPSVVTPSRFEVTPVVGLLNGPMEDVCFKLDPLEVSETLWVPFSSLLVEETYRLESIRSGDVNYPIDVFQYDRYRIWGATGSMTKNLIDRYRFQL